MTSLFETKNGSFEIKENQKSWTIKKIIDSDKLTINFNNTVTIRNRDNMEQITLKLDEVKEFILKSL